MNTSDDLKNITLVAFDMDGTIALSKQVIDSEMADLLSKLLEQKKVAVTSGGAFSQFEIQLISKLPKEADLSNLFVLPQNSAAMHAYIDGEWKIIYDNKLTEEERKKIFGAFEKALKEADFQKPEKIYGILIEDLGGQVTFSANGSDAPLKIKEVWDPDHKKRLKIKEKLDNYLSEFNVLIGGTTTINVTRKGIDKAFGLEQLTKYLNLNDDKIIYVGDALYEGGNDAPVLRLPIRTHQVKDVEDTKSFIKSLL